MTYPQLHESSSVFGFGDSPDCARKKTGRNSVSTAEPALNNRTVKERDVSLILHTPGVRPAQATPSYTYDGISARDEFLRQQAERGSRELLNAMRRELQAMGRLA